jgi:hypothetical protein
LASLTDQLGLSLDGAATRYRSGCPFVARSRARVRDLRDRGERARYPRPEVVRTPSGGSIGANHRCGRRDRDRAPLACATGMRSRCSNATTLRCRPTPPPVRVGARGAPQVRHSHAPRPPPQPVAQPPTLDGSRRGAPEIASHRAPAADSPIDCRARATGARRCRAGAPRSNGRCRGQLDDGCRAASRCRGWPLVARVIPLVVGVDGSRPICGRRPRSALSSDAWLSRSQPRRFARSSRERHRYFVLLGPPASRRRPTSDRPRPISAISSTRFWVTTDLLDHLRDRKP